MLESPADWPGVHILPLIRACRDILRELPRESPGESIRNLLHGYMLLVSTSRKVGIFFLTNFFLRPPPQPCSASCVPKTITFKLQVGKLSGCCHSGLINSGLGLLTFMLPEGPGCPVPGDIYIAKSWEGMKLLLREVRKEGQIMACILGCPSWDTGIRRGYILERTVF